MTSTLSKRSFLFVLLIVAFVSSTAAQGDFYYGDNAISGDTGFSIPDYDSHKEILAEFVAPFLLIAIVLQVGLERALIWTMADNDQNLINNTRKKEKERNRRRATVLSLVITGILVPTKFFQYINDATAAVFGGMIYLVFFLFAVTVFWIIYRVITA